MLFALRKYSDVVPLAHNFVGHHLHFVADLVETTAHKALDRVNRVFWVGDGLPLSDLAHQPLTRFGECDDRWSGSSAFFVRDNLGLATFHYGNDGVRRAQVNSNNLCHLRLLLLRSSIYDCR